MASRFGAVVTVDPIHDLRADLRMRWLKTNAIPYGRPWFAVAVRRLNMGAKLKIPRPAFAGLRVAIDVALCSLD